MGRQFTGWIPNVAGRLSFSHIGQTKHPGPCRVYNEDDGVFRLVLCAQRRNLADALLAPGYFKFVYGFDPAWHFVFLASTEAEGDDSRARLKGHVYAFSKNQWLNGACSAVEDAISEAEVSFQECHANLDVSRQGEIHDELIKMASYYTPCELSRDGVTTLEDISSSKEVFFSTGITKAPAQVGDMASRYLANQSYFFLKDISHHHRHHHRRADTITVAHPSDGGVWVRETQYGIHRRVIEKRRSRAPMVLYDALGVMAYLKSFRDLVKARNNKNWSDALGDYSLKETEDSLKSSLEKHRWNRVQWNLIFTAIPTLLLTLTALLRDEKTHAGQKTIFGYARDSLAGVFTPDIYGFAPLAILISSLVVMYGLWNPVHHFNNLKRISLSWSKKRQIVTHLTICIALIIPPSATIYLYSVYSISSDFAWNLAFSVIAAICIVNFLFPYVFTIPDLFRRLRRYPDYSDLPSDDVFDEKATG